MAIYCAVYGCSTNNNNPERILYPFPLEDARCSAWLQVIGRPDLAHLGVHNLHNNYRICDLHFAFLDQNRMLLNNAVPNINLPPRSVMSSYSRNIPLNINCQQNVIEDTSKSTQTTVYTASESTQTQLSTNEVACQTEILYCQDSQLWKIDNPLKRKLLITLAIDPKAPKLDDNSEQTSTSLNTYSLSNLQNAQLIAEQNSSIQASLESVMCQPDILSIVAENSTEKKKTEVTYIKKETEKSQPKKKSTSKKSKYEEKTVSKPKRKYTKRVKVEKITRPPSEPTDSDETSDSEQEDEKTEAEKYNVEAKSRLEEAITLIQLQWNIHEKKYRKDKPNEAVEIVDPVEKLKIKQGRAYGKELKFLALNLFYSNPVAYRALRQHLNLPTEKTLRRIEVGISTKLTPTVMSLLNLIVSKLKEEERYCVMCANLLPLKEEIHKIANSDKSIGHHEINEVQNWAPACKTLVVMLQGIYSDWKQPLITCYLREHFDYPEVNAWLDSIIRSLQEIGLKVVAFTTNENQNLLGMAKERNISTQRPFFFVNNQKIFYIFDISHLMNSIRNLLISNYFRYIEIDGSEHIASWFDIEKLFETDKTRAYKLAPKLTENHIRPNDLDKTRIQFAAQVFSKTVATGIVNCIDTKHLTTKGYGTVRFVQLLNDVFDVLNSYDETDPCRFKIPFSFKDYQMDVLEKMLNILPSFKIVTKNYEDFTMKVETLKCLEITIRAFIILATDMKIRGIEYLPAKNLGLENLDLFFESMRRKWGFKPTAVLFYAGFRNFFLENIIKKSESNDSCGLDKDLIEILLKDSSDPNVSTQDASTTKDYNPFFKYL